MPLFTMCITVIESATCTCFAPSRVRTHQVRSPELIIYFQFRVRLHLQWIKEREITVFCVILFCYAQNVVFFAR